MACDSAHPAYCETWLPRNLLGMLRAEGSADVTRGGDALASHFFGQSSFGQYAIADERSAVKVDSEADLTVLAPLGCGVLTGFGSMWNVLDPATPFGGVKASGWGREGGPEAMASYQRSHSMVFNLEQGAVQ